MPGLAKTSERNGSWHPTGWRTHDGLPSLDIMQEPGDHLPALCLNQMGTPSAPACRKMRARLSDRIEDVDTDLGARLPTTLAALPASCRGALHCAAPQAEWMVSVASTNRRVWRREACGQLHAIPTPTPPASSGPHPPQYPRVIPGRYAPPALAGSRGEAGAQGFGPWNRPLPWPCSWPCPCPRAWPGLRPLAPEAGG